MHRIINCLSEIDITDFQIVDFEHCVEMLGRTADAITDAGNRPCMADAKAGLRPAAMQMDALAEYCWAEQGRLVRHLAGIRYDDPAHERRRWLLIVSHEISLGGDELDQIGPLCGEARA